MNYKFRKRPVTIEAFQMTEERRQNNFDWPTWLHEAWNKQEFSEGSVCIDPNDLERKRLCIGTLEGVMRVDWNDWIIKGVKGELYPCKPDIFQSSYEEVI